MAFPDLARELTYVRRAIAQAVERGGHGQQVRLVAVTKNHGPEAIEAAWAAGITEVGENKVQEALGKMDALADAPCTKGGVRWHLIGHLQSNKAKALTRFDLFHALDRDSIVAAANEVAIRAERKLEVLVQVNPSGEETKGGFAPAEVPQLAERLMHMPSLVVKGVMTMAPLGADERVLRTVFGKARQCAVALRHAGHPATELSMGMSDDFEVAIEEGATIVRLGTILFGARS